MPSIEWKHELHKACLEIPFKLKLQLLQWKTNKMNEILARSSGKP